MKQHKKGLPGNGLEDREGAALGAFAVLAAALRGYAKNDILSMRQIENLRSALMKNNARIKYFYETLVSNHKLEELPDFISPNCVVRQGEDAIHIGVDGMRQHLIAVRQTYPDYTMKITRQYTDGEYVISEFIMTGTHRGVFLGITPTNEVISITGVDIDKMVDGKIVEHGGAANTFDAFWEHHLIEPV